MASTSDTPQDYPVRLQKYLARSGVASRRGSENLMTAGRVTVNGVVVTELGLKIDPTRDVVTVDGNVVEQAQASVYVALNKPAGYVTTMSDPQGRPTVASLVPVALHPGLFPVGRLDAPTTGLLLFTTDGELSHRLLHPRWKVPKTYRLVADGQPGEGAISQLTEGLVLDDGPTAPAKVRMLDHGSSTSEIEITISEGRKRQVRRMFSAVGHPVIELQRIAFGPVRLADLPEGSWRYLAEEEVRALRDAVGDTRDEGDT